MVAADRRAAAAAYPRPRFCFSKKRPSPSRRGCEKLFLASPSHGTDQAKGRRKKRAKRRTKKSKKRARAGEKEREVMYKGERKDGDEMVVVRATGESLVYPVHREIASALGLTHHHMRRTP